MTASKDEILRAVAGQRRALLSLVRSLDPEQFDTQTALPGWRVREIVGHVISLDVTSVNGKILLVAFSSMDKLERWNDRQAARWADRPVPDLLLGLDRWGRRFLRLARTVPPSRPGHASAASRSASRCPSTCRAKPLSTNRPVPARVAAAPPSAASARTSAKCSNTSPPASR